MTEFSRIARYLAPLSSAEGLGLLDDAALIFGSASHHSVITKDAIVEGIHFLPNTSPADIATKLIRTNLSDMAAMGAVPKFYLIAAILPHHLDDRWYQEFTAQLAIEQALWGIHLIGGDTVIQPRSTSDTPFIILSLTMMGEVAENQALRRNGAKEGDMLYVSGTIGDAALGLAVAQQRMQGVSLPEIQQQYLLSRYHIPQPRIALGQRLCGVASSCMDVSDGLMGDIAHIATCSGVGAVVYASALPLSNAAQTCITHDSAWLETVATGGDDYELVFTVSPEKEKLMCELVQEIDVPITRIGAMVGQDRGVQLLNDEGIAYRLMKQSYVHGE